MSLSFVLLAPVYLPMLWFVAVHEMWNVFINSIFFSCMVLFHVFIWRGLRLIYLQRAVLAVACVCLVCCSVLQQAGWKVQGRGQADVPQDHLQMANIWVSFLWSEGEFSNFLCSRCCSSISCKYVKRTSKTLFSSSARHHLARHVNIIYSQHGTSIMSRIIYLQNVLIDNIVGCITIFIFYLQNIF